MAENKEKYKEWNYCFAEWKAEITIDDRRVTSCSACEGQNKKGRRCVLRWGYPAPNAEILTWRLSWQMSWIFLCRFRVAVFFVGY